jgi:hypothetical protein
MLATNEPVKSPTHMLSMYLQVRIFLFSGIFPKLLDKFITKNGNSFVFIPDLGIILIKERVFSSKIAPMSQLKVHIRPEKEDDKQEIDSLSRSLRDDLSHLDVEEVHLLYEKPPPGSKAFEGVALGSMVVDLVGGGAIKEVTQTVQAWIQRNENRSITIETPDGDKIDVKGISAKDQQKIIDAWVMRQTQKMK